VGVCGFISARVCCSVVPTDVSIVLPCARVYCPVVVPRASTGCPPVAAWPQSATGEGAGARGRPRQQRCRPAGGRGGAHGPAARPGNGRPSGVPVHRPCGPARGLPTREKSQQPRPPRISMMPCRLRPPPPVPPAISKPGAHPRVHPRPSAQTPFAFLWHGNGGPSSTRVHQQRTMAGSLDCAAAVCRALVRGDTVVHAADKCRRHDGQPGDRCQRYLPVHRTQAQSVPGAYRWRMYVAPVRRWGSCLRVLGTRRQTRTKKKEKMSMAHGRRPTVTTYQGEKKPSWQRQLSGIPPHSPVHMSPKRPTTPIQRANPVKRTTVRRRDTKAQQR